MASPPAPALSPPAPTIPADAPPIKLGAVCDRLGFIVSEHFVRETLKVPTHRDGRAVLLAASDWPRLTAALVAHITRMASRGPTERQSA